jgi:hypothetical protein
MPFRLRQAAQSNLLISALAILLQRVMCFALLSKGAKALNGKGQNKFLKRNIIS